MTINEATRKKNNKGVGKPRIKTTTVRRDMRLVTGNLHGVSTPHTLDAAIRNCIRAMDNPRNPYHRFWNQNKLNMLLAIQKGKIRHARIR